MTVRMKKRRKLVMRMARESKSRKKMKRMILKMETPWYAVRIFMSRRYIVCSEMMKSHARRKRKATAQTREELMQEESLV